MSEANRTNNINTSDTHTEDPLAELARIVSGDSTGDTTQNQPNNLAEAENVDFGLDLESELLRELDSNQAEAAPNIDEIQLAEALGASSAPYDAPITSEQSFEDQLLNELDLGQSAQATEQAVNPPQNASPIEKQMQADLQAAEAAIAVVSPAQASDATELPEPEQTIDFAQIAELPTENAIESAIEKASELTNEQVAKTVTSPASGDSDNGLQMPIDTHATQSNDGVNNELDDIFAQGFADELADETLTPDQTHESSPEIPQVEDLGEAFEQSITQIEQNAAVNMQEMEAATVADTAPQPSFESQFEPGIGNDVQGSQSSQGSYDTSQFDINQQFEAAIAPESVSDTSQQYDQPLQPDLGGATPQYTPDYAQEDNQYQMDSAMDAAFADPGSLGSEDMEHPTEHASDTQKPNGGLKLAFGALAVALIAGLGIVGWGAMNNDTVTSDANVPVITAEPSPTKVKPQDPGGKKIANTENKVYENVAGSGDVETKQEKLIDTRQALKPIDTNSNEPKNISRLQPAAEKVNRNSLGGVSPKKVRTLTIKPDGSIVRAPAATNQLVAAVSESASETASLVPSIVPSKANVPAPIRPTAAPSAARQSAITANQRPIVNQVVRSTTPKIAAQSPTTSAPTTITNTRPVSTPVSTPVNTQANRPATITTQAAVPTANTNRPTNIAALPRSNASSNAPTSVVANSASIPAGTYTVQVSSQRSDAAAKASYQNIKKRFSSVIGNRQAVIQKASVQGKGTFFRAKIPTNSKAEATKLCTSLKRAGGSCFVSRS